MAFIAERKYPDDEILSILPVPLYTGSRIYYEEDLEDIGLRESLEGFSDEMRSTLLDHAKKMSRIQPELAFHYLRRIRRLLELIAPEDLEDWVRVLLDIYDSEGLNPAREFILQLDKNPVFSRFWGKGLAFYDVKGILQTYLDALGARDIHLAEGTSHYTDLKAVYLPVKVSVFEKKEWNFLLYKVMVTHKYAQIKSGIFQLDEGDLSKVLDGLHKRYGRKKVAGWISPLSRLFHSFPDPPLARDLYLLLENARIEHWIMQNCPGLYNELTSLKRYLSKKRPTIDDLSPKNRFMEGMIDYILQGDFHSFKNDEGAQFGKNIRRWMGQARNCADVNGVFDLLEDCYGVLHNMRGPYRPVEPVLFIGSLEPEEAEKGRREKRESTKLQFRKELAKLIEEPGDVQELRIEKPRKNRRFQQGTPQHQEVPYELLINGKPLPVPETMSGIINEIFEDLGSIPASYLAVADDMTGHFFRPLTQMPEGTGYVFSEKGEGVHVIDEWDYRRQGYRKRWVLLRETEAPTGSAEFAARCLTRHRGMIRRIRRLFERIRMDDMRLKRQKEGDDVDLDAAVEAFSDRKAGLTPSDKVFVHLRRDKRNIAAAFLVDLSGSTSGWINEMERESLLILCEAVQVLKDRFSIYGFSGRTRRRCQLFRIKGFDNPYDDMVRRRISNLKPLEYTRMGPPIRHLSNVLNQEEAKNKLLITLSDGKPEDWDGYKGDYGIEDTRRALLETKLLGIHPFCITIDKAEHSYLSHMYGPVNYTFIDNISKLPVKIPEIYKKLTS